MGPKKTRSVVVALTLVALPATGCEAISGMVGMAKVAKEVGKHLEEDLKAELTDAKIDKVLEVTPALREFSKDAEHKWELDPDAPDFSKLASAMGAMSDYMAFFESHDTRLTEYYVDMVKIADARTVVHLEKAHAEAIAKHDAEREDLQEELAAATEEDRPAIEKKLERNAAAKEKLEEAHERSVEAREKRRHQKGSDYRLSDEEIERVRSRLDEIDAVLNQKTEQD